jgi:dimethylaniline monooxygenase (N-oxide forming)
MYQYSDFPWPDTVTEVFPDHRQVTEYLQSYARHFGVLDCIRFGHRVVGMEYDGVDEGSVGGVGRERRDVRVWSRRVASRCGRRQWSF